MKESILTRDRILTAVGTNMRILILSSTPAFDNSGIFKISLSGETSRFEKSDGSDFLPDKRTGSLWPSE
jgi:hypothetical protein